MEKEEMKDVTYVQLGASNHSLREREMNDFYATAPRAIDALFKVEDFSKNIWVFSKRINTMSGILLDGEIPEGGAVSYSWFVWEKGYTGKTTLGWI